MNGGQVALTGFKLQVLWTLMEGFLRDDWRAVTVEPTDEDGSLGKVDIRWELLGAERHDQVKSTVNTFGEGDVRRWAAELQGTSSAEERRLILLGVPASGVRPSCILGDVEVRVRARDEETLAHAAAYLMERLCREVGIRPAYGGTESLLELILGLVLARASRGHRWTREELVAQIELLTSRLRGQLGDHRIVDPRERADRVQAAMRAHGMARASDCARVDDRTVVYRTCEWPPPRYADPDGYHEVRVAEEEGPGRCEADGTNYADRITTNSPAVELSYSFGSQGYYAHEAPFRACQGDVLMSNGESYDDRHGPIPFYPDRDEIVVLHNGKHSLDRVKCLQR